MSDNHHSCDSPCDYVAVSVEEGTPVPFVFSMRKLMKFLGPGLLMSIAFVVSAAMPPMLSLSEVEFPAQYKPAH